MRFIFCVQASATIGLGHLMRCQALAQTVIAHDMDAVFLLDDETRRIALARQDWQGQILPFDYAVPLAQQLSNLQATLPFPIEWIVVDGYQFTRDFCQQWRDLGHRVALFDDDVHETPLAADAVINAAHPPDEERHHLFGSDFRLLRREFKTVMPLSVSQRFHLTLNFGGSDPFGLTIPLLKCLASVEFDAPIRVVTGGAYQQVEELNKAINDLPLSIQHIHDAQDMADVWSHARLAISAAGGSQFEIAVCKTPAILVVVAENQITASQQAEQEGWCRIHYLHDVSETEKAGILADIARQAKQLWSEADTLSQMQDALNERYDAFGGERLMDALLELSSCN
ncbi:UDP-2,4-diacetamido-2,4,6-trideoxy-beta-L-altropyranose hydrolase [Alteromonas facilis]|uniref:UDP-2,4-diacetamido-2,4, 6-trideoxy-beta-L-altropyranose hydrolase n=1 Tax=Alteromonas facilis TaxID=2048004 RepID=UPI000C285FB1|nr:UDP-2,4-diacetamido-2,4,6-trideoxy-beta-L-altropyranose hydrolase [Alteromonas facilis]